MTGKPLARRRRTYDLAGCRADFPQRTGAPDSTLVICCQPRSGSTLLGEALFFAGGFGCPLEYFNVDFRGSFEKRWQTDDLPSFVRALHRHRTDPSGVLGVKLFWNDVPGLLRELAPGRFDWMAGVRPSNIDNGVYCEIHALLQTILPNPRHVWLRRDDMVAQAVSVSVANQRRRWLRIDASDPAHSRNVEFRFDRLLGSLARIQRRDTHWRRYFAANRLDPIDVRYEALAHDYPGEVRRLLAILGRGNVEVAPPRLLKQADAESERLAVLFRKRFSALTGTEA